MCFADWRAGRLIRTVVNTIGFNTGDKLIYPANMQRVGISFYEGLGVTTLTNTAIVTVDNTGQFAVPVNTLGLHFTLATHGDLPTHTFVVSKQAGAPVILVLEYIAPEEMIVAAIEDFKRSYPYK